MRNIPASRSHTAGRLLSYVGRGYQMKFILVLLCILVSAIASVSGSLFLGSLIDDYIEPLLVMADPDFGGLLRALILMGCLYLTGALCAFVYNRLMVTISQGVQKKIRDDLFGHMQTLPIKYFDTHAHGDVMSVYTNDVDTLRQMFSQSIPQVINSGMMIVVAFVGMLWTDLLMTGVVIVCIICMLFVTRFLASRSGRYFMRQQTKHIVMDLSPLLNLDGTLVGVFTLHNDLTEMYEQRNRIAQLNDRIYMSASHAQEISTTQTEAFQQLAQHQLDRAGIGDQEQIQRLPLPLAADAAGGHGRGHQHQQGELQHDHIRIAVHAQAHVPQGDRRAHKAPVYRKIGEQRQKQRIQRDQQRRARRAHAPDGRKGENRVIHPASPP